MVVSGGVFEAICVTITVLFARISFPQRVLVIVHPDLENPFLDSNLAAEIGDQFFVSSLHLPLEPLREFVHLILLILREFRPESLSPVGIWWGNGWVILRLWSSRKAAAEGQEHVGSGGVIRGGNRRRGGGIGAAVPDAVGRQRVGRMMTVEGLVLDEVLGGEGRWRRIVGVAAVEVAMAAARGAF